MCQVSHGFECQSDIHTIIDHNILVRLITGLEIEGHSCSLNNKSSTVRLAFYLGALNKSQSVTKLLVTAISASNAAADASVSETSGVTLSTDYISANTPLRSYEKNFKFKFLIFP